MPTNANCGAGVRWTWKRVNFSYSWLADYGNKSLISTLVWCWRTMAVGVSKTYNKKLTTKLQEVQVT